MRCEHRVRSELVCGWRLNEGKGAGVERNCGGDGWSKLKATRKTDRK